MVHPKSQTGEKRSSDQVNFGSSWSKKSQIGMYVYNITYNTYVLTPDLIIAMFRLKSYFFLNFFRLLTSQGTKGGLDESVHV